MKMNTCEWCNLSDEDKKYLLFQTEYWQIFLADKQDYIGRCIILSKRHIGALSELTVTEWIDLKDVIDKLEKGISISFGATMFNWSCLMNDFFKSDIPNPHLHIHLRPRYKNPITIDGKQFYDVEFAHRYDNKKLSSVSQKEFESIYFTLKSTLQINI